MPYVSGQKSEAAILDVYKNFFPAAKRLLGPEGTIIMYTRNREYVDNLYRKHYFNLIKEWKITEKPESWLMIFRV